VPERADRVPSQPSQPASSGPEGVRLQKVLAAAGLGSRRACEELIEAGRVEVDGVQVRGQGMRVDPDRAVVHVDGMRIATAASKVYLALNKPRGVVSAMADPQGRTTLSDLISHRHERLFHVGRLDTDTEGLILLMNDGELAHRLAHPSYGIQKTYLAEVAGPVPRELGRTLRAGVDLDDGLVRVDRFRVVGQTGKRVMVEVVLHEGRKHIVRRMLAEVGHPVQQLVRTHIGPVALGALKPGKTRPLGRDELGRLFAETGL
jgi:23S rRNA pseudouridine2605 synthase